MTSLRFSFVKMSAIGILSNLVAAWGEMMSRFFRGWLGLLRLLGRRWELGFVLVDVAGCVDEGGVEKGGDDEDYVGGDDEGPDGLEIVCSVEG